MQTAATEFAEVLKFRFDSGILASDGEAGKLTRVFADSQKRVVTHLGIRVGLLFGKTYYVPIQLVSGAAADLITVSVSLEDIQTHTTKPEGAELSRSTGVMAAGKRIGHLAQLTFHRDTLLLRHLVIERGSREVLLPATMVTNLSTRQISADL